MDVIICSGRFKVIQHKYMDFLDSFERGVVGQKNITFSDNGSGNLESVGQGQVVFGA